MVGGSVLFGKRLGGEVHPHHSRSSSARSTSQPSKARKMEFLEGCEDGGRARQKERPRHFELNHRVVRVRAAG